MSNFEQNKIFAAILVAGIVAMLSGFVAKKISHPHDLHEDAVFVEGGVVDVSVAAAPEVPEPILHLIAEADIATGQKLSRACAACHSFDQGGPNKIGPNMWDTVGNKKGHIDGFSYSDALLEKGGQWDYLSLNKFLWKPKSYIPGTKMNYVGLRKPEDRAAMIAWLRTLAASPAPLPSESQIAAELAELSPPEPEIEEVIEDVAEDAAAEEPSAGEPSEDASKPE